MLPVDQQDKPEPPSHDPAPGQPGPLSEQLTLGRVGRLTDKELAILEFLEQRLTRRLMDHPRLALTIGQADVMLDVLGEAFAVLRGEDRRQHEPWRRLAAG